ncbi:hydroxysteroid dehydrogenase-like protein 1 [Trichonephila clavipes]|nr:hydroxysteroid dehydrogenase-like protein 1 [Trichonephila clavipes]
MVSSISIVLGLKIRGCTNEEACYTTPGHLRYASANLDFFLPVHKRNSLLVELRSAALTTIHERYPDQDLLYVFTDGSATASFGRAGAGAFSNSFNPKEPLSAWSDKFDVQTTYQLISLYRKRGRSPMDPISLRHSWKLTSRQAGQRGFDAASTLASDASLKRQATSQGQITTEENFHSYRPYLRHFLSCLLDGQRRAQLSALPRVEGVACFRIITGHDYFQAHLFKIVLDDSPLSVNSSQWSGSL